jgi:Holliday junction resolvasome RuvABC endonuclease subunit
LTTKKSSLKDIGRPSNIVAVDASTNTIAFAVFNKTNLLHYGKITFSGKDHYQKAGDACRKLVPLFSKFDIDAMVIEGTIYANSPKTSMQLALNQGAIVSAAYINGIKNTYPCAPISWQSWIGNKVLNKEEKAKIRKDNPGKSESWYKNHEREFRKNRTIRLVNIEFMTDVDDNDVADAIAIGWYATNNWNKMSKVDL